MEGIVVLRRFVDAPTLNIDLSRVNWDKRRKGTLGVPTSGAGRVVVKCTQVVTYGESTVAGEPGNEGAVLLRGVGVGGQLELLEDVIRIKRRSPMGVVFHGLKGSKEIPISQITSVQ